MEAQASRGAGSAVSSPEAWLRTVRLRIDDVYKNAADKPYRFNPETDRLTGFRSKSVLCFALKNYADEVIGVVQLINKRDKGGAGPIAFSGEDAALIQPINHIVGGAIEPESARKVGKRTSGTRR